MELSISYILSQLFTIIMYILLGITYFAKKRKTVLLVSFFSLMANALEYAFLSAWTGVAMCIVALIRNLIFMLDDKKNGKRDNITKKDIFILIILNIILILSGIFTFDGWLSLISVLASILYTYSVWQKKTKVYKILGIPVRICLIIYNIYIMSILGILFGTILLICSTSGYILEIKEKSKM